MGIGMHATVALYVQKADKDNWSGFAVTYHEARLNGYIGLIYEGRYTQFNMRMGWNIARWTIWPTDQAEKRG
jgi:hypothetical protein